jgi:hypothetical protein
LTDLNAQWGLEALSGLAALIGLLISSRFAIQRHGTLRSLDPQHPLYANRRRVARTRRRIAATFAYVQVTLAVACVYRLSYPMPDHVFVPSLLRLTMAVAIIRCCLKNQGEWSSDDHAGDVPVKVNP